MSNRKIQVCVNIPPAVYDAVVAAAKAEDRSISYFLARAAERAVSTTDTAS